VPHVNREDPFCGEDSNCRRLGTDVEGNAYIAVASREGHPLPTPARPLAQLISDFKAGKADHLL
jgi:hypothetical protein